MIILKHEAQKEFIFQLFGKKIKQKIMHVVLAPKCSLGINQ
jgi:hypothetical protein